MESVTVLLVVILSAMLPFAIPAVAQEQTRSGSRGATNFRAWGKWGHWDFCPEGTHARAAQLKVERQQGSGDDTALNGIRLYCGDPTDPNTYVITSSVGKWGDWLPLTMICPNELNGFHIKVEPYQGWFRDDAGATNIRFQCIYKWMTSPWETWEKVLEQPDLEWTWGSWEKPINWKCPEQYAICGIRTRVEGDQGSGDDTSLNEFKIICCELNK